MQFFSLFIIPLLLYKRTINLGWLLGSCSVRLAKQQNRHLGRLPHVPIVRDLGVAEGPQRSDAEPVVAGLDAGPVGEPPQPIINTPLVARLGVQREREDVVLAALAGREPLRRGRAIPARGRPDELALADCRRVRPVGFRVVGFEDLVCWG